MNPPEGLFKYLPRQYADELLNGRLFLRNLAYFKRLEHAARGDLAEGMHIDQPDNLVSITAVDGSSHTEGRFAFHNEVDQQRVFAFCMYARTAAL